jgi:hypothetical protein
MYQLTYLSDSSFLRALRRVAAMAMTMTAMITATTPPTTETSMSCFPMSYQVVIASVLAAGTDTTYAPSPVRNREGVQLADDWIITGNTLAFWHWKDTSVSHMSLPDLGPLQPMSEREARASNVLPAERW